MKTVSEARAAVVRAWEELPPVSKLEVREVEPALAQALDELVSVVAAATRVVQAPETWVPEQDPAVRPNVGRE